MKTPTPIPKMNFPLDVSGLVTGSVAMKKAPNRSEPEKVMQDRPARPGLEQVGHAAHDKRRFQ